MKMYELLNVSDQLNSLPLGKLTIAQRAALTRTICAISQARKPFDEALKEAREKLKPEGFDDLKQKKNRSPEEDARLKEMKAEYDSAINETLQPNLMAEVALVINKPMTAEELLTLGDAAPEVTAGNIMYLAEMLGINLNGDDPM